jgi:mercuric ion transport protein
MSDVSGGAPEDRPARGAGAVALTAAGLVAAFGVASCCGLPFLFATAGLGTAWLSGFALMAAPHRVFLLAAAAICLLGAAVLLWRQRSVTVCAPRAICSRPAVRGVTLTCLLLGLALLYLGYAYA